MGAFGREPNSGRAPGRTVYLCRSASRVPKFDPCLHFIYRKDGGAVGGFTTHIGDALGCGVPGFLAQTEVFSEARFGQLKLQESSAAHVGMEVAQGNDYSVRLASAHLLGVSDSSPAVNILGRCSPLSSQIWGTPLARDGGATGYLCAPGQTRVRS